MYPMMMDVMGESRSARMDSVLILKLDFNFITFEL